MTQELPVGREDPDPEPSSLGQDLRQKRRDLETRRSKARTLRNVSLAGVVATPAAVAGAIAADREGLAIALGLYFWFAFIPLALFTQFRARDLASEMQLVGFDIDLARITDEDERMAQNLFLKHQVELKRYYDQALAQSSATFAFGLFCIVAGIAVIGTAGWLVFDGLKSDATSKQIVIGTLGATGGVLAGYISRMYFQIHSGSVLALTNFHQALVETHHLHFANVFAATVGDAKLRNATRADMAKTLTARKLPVDSDDA